MIKNSGQSIVDKGVEKNLGEGIGEAVRVARGAVVSVPDTGVPKLITPVGKVGSNTEGVQSK